nr:MAG TPA: hypothetical protein [Caudoviricetes sp.]
MVKNLLELSTEAGTPVVEEADQPKPKNDGLSKLENRGKAIREKEFTVFARILNFSQLKKANRAEIQEQYIIPIDKTEENAGQGAIRVRKITARNGRSRYELTTKNKMDIGDSIEVTVPTTKENFIQFKVLSSVSMMKHRYTFKIKGTDKKWEVDVVPDGNGSYYPWARCEIEVDDLNDKNVPELPLEVEELILPPELGKLSQEEYDEKTKPIMDRFFTSGNPYVKDGEENSLTELEGEIDDDDTDQPEEEEKPEEETTGDEVMSVDNITDEKDVAEKVETRSEQIVDKREETEGEETEGPEEGEEDGTEEDNADSEIENEGEESGGESEESGKEKPEDSESDEEVVEEVSKESYNYLTSLGIDLSNVKISKESFNDKSLVAKFSEMVSNGLFKSLGNFYDKVFGDPAKSLKGGGNITFSKVGSSNGGAILKVHVKEERLPVYKVTMVPYIKGKDPLDVAIHQLSKIPSPESIEEVINQYKSNLEFYKVWVKNFKTIVEKYQEGDDEKYSPEDLMDYISYYDTDKRIFEYRVPEFKNYDYKDIDLNAKFSNRVPVVCNFDSFDDKIILSNEKDFKNKMELFNNKSRKLLSRYKELLKTVESLESPLSIKNPANEFVGRGDGDEYHDPELLCFQYYVSFRLTEIIDMLELTYVKELYSLYGLNSDKSISQEGFGSPESITHPETTPAPVEVTQGESDTPSETQQRVQYVPTLNALAEMSKFQEGHREFDVKSCDEWQ